MSMRGKQYGIIRVAFCLMVLLGVPLTAYAGTTLQNAITADATGKNISVADKGSVGVAVTISGTATATFQGSADGGATWATISCTALGGTTGVTSAAATGQYLCSVAGMTHFQTPVSGCSGCTVTVFAQSSMPSSGSTSGSAISSLGTATAAAPSLAEGAAGSFSFNLSGAARFTLTDLIFGEDSTNNLLMTSGGAVRITQLVGTGGVPSTASDATTSASILPVGKKTFHGIVTCTGTCVQIQKIYGAFESSATVAKSVLVCTLNPGASAASTNAVDWCTTDLAFSYWFVVTSSTSGTTPLSAVMAMY